MKDLPPLILAINDKRDLEQVVKSFQMSQDKPSIWEEKGLHYLMRLYDLNPQAIYILKQEALALGIDCLFFKNEDSWEALMGAFESQLLSLSRKLNGESSLFSSLGKNMEELLQNLRTNPRPSSFRGKTFQWGERTYIMGIINLTPDSFSGDGLSGSIERALQKAEEMVNQGADIIDVGAESTRPGHTPITAEEEWRRLEPFLREFLPWAPVPVSLDTYKEEVAKKGLEMGVDIINDIWGLRRSPGIGKLVQECQAGLILMHNREEPIYRYLLPEVLRDLKECVDWALEWGISREKIIVDPGFGFGKTAEHGYQILKNLRAFRSLGFPLLVGLSRKSFIGKITGKPPQERLMGTAAYCALAIEEGCDILRVHDVAEIKEVASVCDRIFRSPDTAPV